MLQTQLGEKMKGWAPKSKAELKNDLEKLTKAPLDILRAVVDKIARTYPACNATELAALEAEQRGIPHPQDLTDAISVFTYIWGNVDGESPQAITADLVSLELLSNDAGRILTELLLSAEPYRESARVASTYTRIGSSLFVGLHGTVDVRLRFHNTDEDFVNGKLPTELVGTQQLIVANLTLSQLDGEEVVVSFLMDEDDLRYMKKFIRNMEQGLELSRGLLKSSELKSNG